VVKASSDSRKRGFFFKGWFDKIDLSPAKSKEKVKEENETRTQAAPPPVSVENTETKKLPIQLLLSLGALKKNQQSSRDPLLTPYKGLVRA